MRLIASPDLRRTLARNGRRTILARHTCGHRVDPLMAICTEPGIKAEGMIANVATGVVNDR